MCGPLIVDRGSPIITRRPDEDPTVTDDTVQTIIGRRRVVVGLGKTLRIECTAIGSPDTTISWYRNGVIVSDSGRRRTLADGTLVVNDFESLDSASYTCEARNREGTDTETITVDEAGTMQCCAVFC